MNEPKQEIVTPDDWPPTAKPGDGAAPDAATEPAVAVAVAEAEPAAPAASATDDLLVDILRSVYRAEGSTTQGFAALRERLAAIEEKLGICETPDVEGEGSVVEEADEPTEQVVEETTPEPEGESESLENAATDLPPTAMPVAQPMPQMPQPVQPVHDLRPVAVQHGQSELDELVFGQDLAYHEGLLTQRQALLTSVRRGDEDAIGLVGQLLIVRSATMDRLPTLLKDVGEAWYRWRTNDAGGADALRDALIAWLHGKLDAVGLGNRIELVRLGDRYDSKRHNSKARGVEVTGVQGWVVLRDNGNVYTKANVTVA